MRALHLGHRHLELLEGVVVDALLQRAQHDFMGHRVLFGKTLGRNGLQARDERLVARMLRGQRRERTLVQAVVVSVVAVRGGPFGMGLQIGLVLLLEECVLRRQTLLDGRAPGRGRRAGRKAATKRHQAGFERGSDHLIQCR